MENKYLINIGHLYPRLLNLYGDAGNIASLKKRLEWRGIEANVKVFELEDEIDFHSLDIVLIGGGSDREQLLVCNRLREIKKDFLEYIENNGVCLALCSGYEILGNYYKTEKETIEGLSILDTYTEQGNTRLIGDIVIQSQLDGKDVKIVGFENHGGRTYIGNAQPFGKVLMGFGNNGKDKSEGIIYKNCIGTYLHGPLLPKNPEVTDTLIKKALENKYGEGFILEELDDTLEWNAREYMLNKLKS